MASIKEAYDSTIGESFTGLKLLLWAIPLSYCRDIVASGHYDFISGCIVAVFAVLLLGFLAESANNASIKKEVLIPGINLLSMAYNGLKTILALGVYTAIAYFGGTFLCGLFDISADHAVLDMTAKIIIWLLLIAIPASGFIIYLRKLSLIDAYNIKRLGQVMGDTFIMFSYLIVKLGILTTLVIGFISYLFWMFVGFDNYLISYIWSIAILYNLVIGVNYFAQYSEELITLIEKREGKETIEAAKLY